MPVVYTPKAGFSYSPLIRCNRNVTCFMCDSGKKLKKCCGRYRFVKDEFVKEVCDVLDKIGPQGRQLVGYKGEK